MRKSALLIGLLSGASFMLRRSRRFGPIQAIVIGAILEEVVRRLRAEAGPKRPVAKTSLWAKLVRPKRASAQTERGNAANAGQY